jgi:hypothetical protein
MASARAYFRSSQRLWTDGGDEDDGRPTLGGLPCPFGRGFGAGSATGGASGEGDGKGTGAGAEAEAGPGLALAGTVSTGESGAVTAETGGAARRRWNVTAPARIMAKPSVDAMATIGQALRRRLIDGASAPVHAVEVSAPGCTVRSPGELDGTAGRRLLDVTACSRLLDVTDWTRSAVIPHTRAMLAASSLAPSELA